MGKKELVKLGHDGKGFTLDGERLGFVKNFKYETFEVDGYFKAFIKAEVYEADDKGLLKTREVNGQTEFVTVVYNLEVDDSELYKPEVEYFTDAVLEIAREDNKVEVSILDKQ